jgi:hypothetical protein
MFLRPRPGNWSDGFGIAYRIRKGSRKGSTLGWCVQMNSCFKPWDEMARTMEGKYFGSVTTFSGWYPRSTTD